jgi:hypothetical protein
MDPVLGPVFYTLAQPSAGGVATEIQFERHLGRCLRCHDSYSMTGGGVPRLLLGSGYIGGRGELVSHEAWIVTTPRTPIRNRWGGWYVTGFHGDQPHLGNIVVRDIAALSDLDALRVGNLADLNGVIDTVPYPTAYSDIVALLVIEHQIHVQNAIARLNFDYSNSIDIAGTSPRSAPRELVEPLVEALFMVAAAPLNDRVESSSGFRAQFEAQGPVDSSNRLLRQLDLGTRVFRYPLSYLIYSPAFDALAEPLRRHIYGRIDEILSGLDQSEEFAHLTPADRRAIREILIATKPEFRVALDAG